MDALSILALGVAQAGGGGGGGTSDYSDLSNKPQINNVTLSGNKSLSDLGIQGEIEGNSISPSQIEMTGLNSFVDITPDNGISVASGAPGMPSKGIFISPGMNTIDILDEDRSQQGMMPMASLGVSQNSELTVNGIPVSMPSDLPEPDGVTIIDSNGVWSAVGGGSSSGAVRYDEAQTLSNAEFNQVMSNLQLGATKGVVQDWKFKGQGSTTFSAYHSASLYPDSSIPTTAIAQGEECEVTLCINNDEQTLTRTATNANNFANFNATVGNVSITTVGQNGAGYWVYTDDATTTDTLTKIEIKTTPHTTVTTKISSDLLPAQVLGITNTTGIKTNIGTSRVSSAAADSIAIGNGAQANNQYGIAIGSNNSAGQSSVVIGYNLSSAGNSSQSAYIGEDIRPNSNNNYVFGARGYLDTTVSQGNLVLSNRTANYPYWRVNGPYNYAVVARDYKTYPEESANYIIEGYNNKIISSSGTTVSSFKGTVIGERLVNSGQYTTVIGKNNADKYIDKISIGNSTSNPIYSTTNAPNWSSSTAYAVGDVVNYQGYLFSCKQAHTNHAPNYQNTSGNDYWGTFGEGVEGYAFVIGNGADNDNRSNALTVDWSGNLVCNNIPACPSTDGTYNLQVSIVNGVPTYSWVAV